MNIKPKFSRKMFRSMKKDIDGLPVVRESSSGLGVRAGEDIPVADGRVEPNTGGMSVTPDDPRLIPASLRPRELGGYAQGRCAFFLLESDLSGRALSYRSDPEKPREHGFIEPSREMPISDYKSQILDTRDHWKVDR